MGQGDSHHTVRMSEMLSAEGDLSRQRSPTAMTATLSYITDSSGNSPLEISWLAVRIQVCISVHSAAHGIDEPPLVSLTSSVQQPRRRRSVDGTIQAAMHVSRSAN